VLGSRGRGYGRVLGSRGQGYGRVLDARGQESGRVLGYSWGHRADSGVPDASGDGPNSGLRFAPEGAASKRPPLRPGS